MHTAVSFLWRKGKSNIGVCQRDVERRRFRFRFIENGCVTTAGRAFVKNRDI